MVRRVKIKRNEKNAEVKKKTLPISINSSKKVLNQNPNAAPKKIFRNPMANVLLSTNVNT
jgi:hypothetical protein